MPSINRKRTKRRKSGKFACPSTSISLVVKTSRLTCGYSMTPVGWRLSLRLLIFNLTLESITCDPIRSGSGFVPSLLTRDEIRGGYNQTFRDFSWWPKSMMRHKLCFWLFGLLVGISLSRFSCAQNTGSMFTSGTSPTSGATTSGTDMTFQEMQQSLAQGWQNLQAQGASTDQVNAWLQQNASLIATCRQQAQKAGDASALQPLPIVPAVSTTAGLSGVTGTGADFNATQVNLANALPARLHNRLLLTSTNASQLRQEELTIFQQQHGADLALQVSRSQFMGSNFGSHALPMPLPLTMSPQATPRQKLYLVARDTLMRSWITMWNQVASADQATRQAAIAQWQQQNASRIAQLKNLLSPASQN